MELRYLYVGSADVGSDLAGLALVPGVRLRWRFRHFGADVAAVDPGSPPCLLLADHRPPGTVLPIYRVDALGDAVATLASGGGPRAGPVGTPEGPAISRRRTGGLLMALLRVDRPDAMGPPTPTPPTPPGGTPECRTERGRHGTGRGTPVASGHGRTVDPPRDHPWNRVSPVWPICAGPVSVVGIPVVAGRGIPTAWASTATVAVIAVVGLALLAWGWRSIGRNLRSWGYAERPDDLVITHGAMFKKIYVVPYGRMQLVDVEAGPIERSFGLVRVKLHTAAATTDAKVCGLLRRHGRDPPGPPHPAG